MEQAQADAEPGTKQAGAALAGRIYQDYLAKHGQDKDPPGLLQFIENLAQSESVTNEDRGPHRAFWSYKSELEGESRAVPNRFLARACGESRGLQVLEDTPAGYQLNSYCLGNQAVMLSLAQHFDFDAAELDAAHGQAWDTLSDRFAKATEGLAIPFAADITKGSVLGATEMPALLQNSEVGKEGVKFATPLPRHEHLPPDIDAFISNNPVRCQLFKGDYDPEKSPGDCAQRLASIDVPEDQKAAHKEVLDRLEAANSYKELNAPAPEPKPKGLSAQAKAFLPGVAVGRGVVPAAPRGPTGHGVINPVAAEIAPKQTGIEH
ncbi:hypothetical protein [Streptomyces sp. NPDC091371]|uniref:hypothetical protein n=1 Tax=Streptomyces sp. NPDC091371 TaxID=3155303 RepID=UPI003429FF8E